MYSRLKQALNLLPKKYSFILYDGYRPFQVQQYLYTFFLEQIKTNYPNFTEEQILTETLKYVAFPSLDPIHPVPHLTGGAIDLTLGDLDGNTLDLGTVFDELDKKSSTRYFEHHPEENAEALMHRRLLYNCMTDVGFANYSEEWWHYDFGNTTWAKGVDAGEALYGPIEADIQDNEIKGYRYYL